MARSDSPGGFLIIGDMLHFSTSSTAEIFFFCRGTISTATQLSLGLC